MNDVDFGIRTSLVIEFLLLSLFDTSISAKLEGVIKHMLVKSCSV